MEFRPTKIITIHWTYLDPTELNSNGEKYPFRSKYDIYRNFCLKAQRLNQSRRPNSLQSQSPGWAVPNKLIQTTNFSCTINLMYQVWLMKTVRRLKRAKSHELTFSDVPTQGCLCGTKHLTRGRTTYRYLQLFLLNFTRLYQHFW